MRLGPASSRPSITMPPPTPVPRMTPNTERAPAAAPSLGEKLFAGQTPEPAADDPIYSAGTQKAVATLREGSEAKAVSGDVVDAVEIGFAEINQLIGQIQMANSFARFADVVSLQKLAHIKETKAYKASKGVTVNLPNGEIADVGTWDGFCQALGMSVSKVDEDLINLRAFGEQALESLSRIGAGYRELRQWRKLPQEQREALAQIATTGNKDDVLEAAYEAIEAERAKSTDLAVKNVQESKSEAPSSVQGAMVEAGLAPAPAPDSPSKPKTVVNDAWSKTPRNAPCPCGSGKKFKMCHGATV